MPTVAPETFTQTTSTNITLRYTRCAAAPTTSSLAAQLGYLEDEFKDEPGLTLSLASLSLDPKVNPTRAEQFSLRHAGTKSAWARAQGARLRIVALSHLQSYYSLWALAGSGIGSVADSKGRRLGVVITQGEETLDLARAGSLQAYEGALGAAGLTLSDVKQVEIPTEKIHFDSKDDPALRRHLHNVTSKELLARLTRGEVDVITGNFPAETVEIVGLRQIFNSREETSPLAKRPALRALVVHETLLEEKFEWVVRILARHLQAAAWAKAHPREAIELVAQDHRTTPEALKARYPNLIEGLQPDLGPDKVESLLRQKDFYLRHGFIARDFSAEDWIERRPLEAARTLAAKRGILKP
jgi:sulfonate transport system substrate-binding protein